MLVEREPELGAIEDALAAAGSRHGSTLLLEGPAGIGKTSLLDAARERAGGRAMRVLAAGGGELEQELAFSAVRQLLEPALRSLPPTERDEALAGAASLARPVFDIGQAPGADPAAVNGVVHGLYWVCSNLADTAPLLLMVDDLHLIDESSLRFLVHLARRLADLPVLLVLAGRPVPPEHLVARALAGVRPRRLGLAPLSTPAVGTLVREILSGDADDRFCQACAVASGGNPFLLTEALRSLRAENVRPVAAEAARVERLQPETISHALLGRLARLGPSAVALARAVAILGPAAELRRVAGLAEVPTRTAAEMLDRLAAEAILTRTRPVEFVHPLVRAAVYADSAAFTRATDYKRAAALLHADGAPADEVAAHLLNTEPESDPWVVETLREAAATAVAQGAPEVAVTNLRRAVAEPPAVADRAPILLQLARSLGMANRPDEAAGVFRTAYELSDRDEQRMEIGLEFGGLMIATGRGADALAAYELARSAMPDGDLAASMRSTVLLMLATAAMEPPPTWIATLEDLVGRGDSGTAAGRMILALLSFGAAAAGDRSAAETARLAGLAATGPLPEEYGWALANAAGAALAIADRFPEALALFDRAIDAARQRGDATAFGYLSMLRSHTAMHAGRLLEAEADGRAAYGVRADGGPQAAPLAAAVLIDALIERGELAEAEQVLVATGLDGELSVGMLIAHFVLMARGRLRLRQGRVNEALSDLVPCGERLAGAGYVNPGFAPWRPEVARAYLRLGERDRAREVAAENLSLAQKFGAEFPIGTALHVAGLIEGGAKGRSLLAEAAAVLAQSSTDLWQGHALVDHGAALRRAGQRSQAQESLRSGLDIAARCGATALADRAAEELVAAGGRPRRARLTGPGSLTASELRVARLAAGGATNREIAQALFISLRTVEIHLTHAYRKLGISSRQRLAAALESG